MCLMCSIYLSIFLSIHLSIYLFIYDMLFSETEIDFENYADKTTPYICDLQMEKVIETLEKKY